MKTWLETSALITLHFRTEREAAHCRTHLPAPQEVVVSAYVLFELARGFLQRILELHNRSHTCTTAHDLRALAQSGDAPYTRKGRTWTEMLDDDLIRLQRLEQSDAKKWRALAPAYFRFRLRNVILDGWEACHTEHDVQNPCGCRANLPPPLSDEAGRLQELPTAQCGAAGNCGVLAYVRAHRGDFAGMHAQQGGMKLKRKAPERARRVEGMAHLLGAAGEDFAGGQCHSCADAIIAHEARGHAVATKDGDLKPLCKVCGTKMVPVPHR